jgi:hypothetical protein
VHHPANSVPAFVLAKPADVVFLGYPVIGCIEALPHLDAVDVLATAAGF